MLLSPLHRELRERERAHPLFANCAVKNMDSDATSRLPITLGITHSIVPSAPTDRSPVFLSQIDRQAAAYFFTIVYFYPTSSSSSSPAGHGSKSIIPSLQRCLADLLVPYHFVAGRLRLNDSGRLEIDCNRKGVLFAAASCDRTMAQLGHIAHPNPAFRDLLLPPPNAHKITDIPLLTVQVTVFNCGGLCIGLTTNHALFDGSAVSEFFLNFASLARGDGMFVEPLPDRTMLKSRDPPHVQFQHPEYVKLSCLPTGTTTMNPEAEDFSFATVQFARTQLSHKHIFKMFPFSGDMLNRLKETAMSDSSFKKCSSFNAIAAHVWQTRAKAIDLPASASAKVIFPVDIRSRIKPSLPKGFAGNAVIPGYACVPADDLKNGSFSFAVDKIREAVNAQTDEYIKSSIDWRDKHSGIPNTHGGIRIVSWLTLPLYLADFGFGKPTYAGPALNPAVELVFLLSNDTQQGVNVFLALEPAHMHQFEKLIYSF